MLYGRDEERALLAWLLERACDGHGGVLVIHGDAGVGTSTLLQDAAEHSSGMRVLHASGVEPEVELPFATLHQLVQPVLDRLDQLPAPQARALRGAFGFADIQPNRFLIELGILNLLVEVAKERPLLCLVDDAQRLDRASADTVVFVARRLESEPIALLVAARDDSVREFLAPGLPELHLGGLGYDAAVQLLEARSGKIARDVCDRLIRETGGNPLALLELPAILSGEQLAGRESMPEWLPLGATLQQPFLWRLRRLPPLTQRLLLVAAAEDTGEVATVLAASQRLAIGPEALEPAEHAGLVQVTDSMLRFRHPLVRSTIYQDATFTARRSVHRALSEVLQGEQHADRRAWHLAAATIRPDEQVASTLERSADRARRRGGPGSTAAALERAASLTPQVGPRARRLAAAAEHLWEAGHSERALTVLDQVPRLAMDVAVRARSAHVRGAIELATGTPAAAYTVLARGAEPILESDPGAGQGDAGAGRLGGAGGQ